MSKIKSLKYFNEQYQQFIEDMNEYLKGTYNTIVEIFGGGSKRAPLYTLYFTPSNSYWRFLTKRELDNKLLDKLAKIGCGFNVDSDKVTFFIKSNNKKDAFEINGNKSWFRQLSKNEDFKEMLDSIPVTFVEIKPYSYKGKIITASSKEEAIAQIVIAGKGHKKPAPDMKFESFFKSIGFKLDKETYCLVLNNVTVSQADFFNDDGFCMYFKDAYAGRYEFNSLKLIYEARLEGLTLEEAEKAVKDYAETIKKTIKKNVGNLKKVNGVRELRAIIKSFPIFKVKTK